MALNIKQINQFQLKYLRMAGFLEYVQQVQNIVKTYRDSGEAGVSQLPAKVEAAYTPFIAGVAAMDQAYRLSRASDFTQQIADEDTRRDGLYLALKSQVQMYQKFTFDTEKKAAATLLWNIIKKYGVDVTENYSEESGKIQQMIQELEDNQQAVENATALGLSSLITQLKTANEAVRTLMSQRNDERMLQEKAALAKARNEADEAYRDLILMLNAAAAMDDDPTRFDEVIMQVNELIKYYRQYVLKSGKGSDDDDKPSGGNGDSNGEGSSSNGGGTSDNGGGSNGGGSNGGGSNGGGSGSSDSGNGSQGGGSNGGGSSSGSSGGSNGGGSGSGSGGEEGGL